MTVFVCLHACFFFNMRCFFQEVHTDILSSDPSCSIHLAKIRSKQCHYLEKKLLHVPFVSCSIERFQNHKPVIILAGL